MKPKRPSPTSEWLHQKYEIEKLSRHEMAKLWGCSQKRMKRLLRSAEISLRSREEWATLWAWKERGPTLLDDPQELRRLYVDEELSPREIAVKIGTNHKMVQRHLQKYGIPIRGMSEARTLGELRKRGPTLLDNPEELRRLYIDEEWSSKEIATEVQTSTGNVKRHLKKYGISLRTSKTAHRTQRALSKISGSRSNFWRGGIEEYPRAPGFGRSLKKEIRARDRNRCVICQTKRNILRDLSVHHVNFNRNDHRPKNLITLCISCHTRIHQGTLTIPKIELLRIQ